MAWTVRFSSAADKQFARLSPAVRARIANFLHRRLPLHDNPTDIGDPLTGKYRGYWKYRVGHYRLIARIVDDELLVLIIRIGHRREVHR